MDHRRAVAAALLSAEGAEDIVVVRVNQVCLRGAQGKGERKEGEEGTAQRSGANPACRARRRVKVQPRADGGMLLDGAVGQHTAGGAREWSQWSGTGRVAVGRTDRP